MASLIVPDESKVPREGLLLGNVVIDVLACDGITTVQVNGITANDLDVRLAGGGTQNLISFIQNGGTGNLAGGNVELSDGSTVNLGQLVEALMSNDNHTLAEAQSMVNNA